MIAKKFRIISIIAATAVVATVLYAAAQENREKAESKGSSTGSTTVTGCLQKGDEPNEFSITENGKTYGLRSTKVDLAKHLGHMVSVTGTLRPETAEKETSEKNEKSEHHEANKEAGDIRVTDLKMIKESCQ